MSERCLCTGRTDIRCDATHCDLAGPADPTGRSQQCRLCWIRLHPDPSLFRQAGNLAVAAAKHLATGGKLVSPEVKAARLAVCAGCEFYDPEPKKCRHSSCGCYLDTKANWSSEDCPLGKWPRTSPAILITGGIGDAIALEGLMTPEDRDRLETICYACPAWREISTLFRALALAYPRLRDHVVLPTGSKVHYSAASVEADTGALPPGVEDWSIARIFPQGRPYLGSSLLTRRLAEPRSAPGPYVVVCPASSWGQWADRNFSEADWAVCLDFLDARGIFGVVLGRERFPLPAHPRLLDWQGQTTILESVEALKAADGYVGIDTWATVLAAKLFPSNRIAIKCVWDHCYQWARVYFAPRTDTSFLRRKLEAPSWT